MVVVVSGVAWLNGVALGKVEGIKDDTVINIEYERNPAKVVEL